MTFCQWVTKTKHSDSNPKKAQSVVGGAIATSGAQVSPVLWHTVPPLAYSTLSFLRLGIKQNSGLMPGNVDKNEEWERRSELEEAERE